MKHGPRGVPIINDGGKVVADLPPVISGEECPHRIGMTGYFQRGTPPPQEADAGIPTM